MTASAREAGEGVLLVIVAWVGACGSIGAILAYRRGLIAPLGVLLGGLGGPLGWLAIGVLDSCLRNESPTPDDDWYAA